jgi:hypothetical protein
MSVKYNSVDRVGVHGMGSSIIRRLRDAAAWLTFNPVAAPVWAPVAIRSRPISRRRRLG